MCASTAAQGQSSEMSLGSCLRRGHSAGLSLRVGHVQDPCEEGRILSKVGAGQGQAGAGQGNCYYVQIA